MNFQTASQRPYARFNVHYSDKDQNPAAILLPHLAFVKVSAQDIQPAGVRRTGAQPDGPGVRGRKNSLVPGRFNQRRTIPHLGAGEDCDTANDIATAGVGGLGGASMVGRATRGISTAPGLDRHAGGVRPCHQGRTRAGKSMALDYMRTHRKELNNLDENPTPIGWLTPDGFFYQNELVMSRMHQEINLPEVDAANHRVYVNLPSGNENDLMNRELSGGFPPYRIFARLLFPALAKARMKSAYSQTIVDETIVACALERYRLAHGELPQTLDALTPQFIQEDSHRCPHGRAAQVSAQRGWEVSPHIRSGGTRSDDGGQVVMHGGSSGSVDITKGDWVWPQYPAK